MKSDFDIRRFFGVLRRNFAFVVGGMLIAGISSLALITFLKPGYVATALVLVERATAPLDGSTTSLASSAPLDVDSEVEIARSDATMMRTVSDAGLISNFERFNGPPTPIDQLRYLVFRARPIGLSPDELVDATLDRLRDVLSVQRRGLTNTIEFQATAPTPDFAATIANSGAKSYIQQQIATKIENVVVARDVVASRLDGAKASVAAGEAEFDDFIADNIAPLATESGQPELIALQETVSDLDEKATQLELQAAELAGDEGIRSRNDALSARQQASDARAKLREQILSGDLSASTLTKLFDIRQRAEIARTQYQTLLQRTEDLTTLANLQVPDSRIVSAARPPASNLFPNTRLIVSASLLLGGLFGTIAAFLFEGLVGPIRDLPHLKASLNARNGISLPKVSVVGEVASLNVDQPLAPFAEAVRRLRATTQFSRQPRSARVLLVTSAGRREGRSTVSLALARACVEAGEKVLLLDCDLRQPGLHTMLSAPPTDLAAHLTDADPEEFDHLLRADANSSLQVVVGTIAASQGTDHLFELPSFQALVRSASQRFDVVVLDTPSLGAADALSIAKYADVIVFVALAQKTSEMSVRHAIGALKEAIEPGTPVVAVLNQQQRSGLAYADGYTSYSYQPRLE